MTIDSCQAKVVLFLYDISQTTQTFEKQSFVSSLNMYKGNYSCYPDITNCCFKHRCTGCLRENEVNGWQAKNTNSGIILFLELKKYSDIIIR